MVLLYELRSELAYYGSIDIVQQITTDEGQTVGDRCDHSRSAVAVDFSPGWMEDKNKG